MYCYLEVCFLYWTNLKVSLGLFAGQNSFLDKAKGFLKCLHKTVITNVSFQIFYNKEEGTMKNLNKPYNILTISINILN